MIRVGLGYDVHALVKSRPLILGGVKIPHSLGLLGHSDADVLTHAVMDALLGALALGDIGKHFPDTDVTYKNADSIKLLERVMVLIEERGYDVGNIDAVIMAEKPKIMPYIPEMVERLARALRVNKDSVSIKATTTEKLGFVGREEGIASQVTVLLYKKDSCEIQKK